ncbi:MAG: TatD family hydrolase [Candidatus Omnitrophota bacterium]
MIIDTHCHLDFDEFNADRDLVIERAKASGVEYFICVGSSLAGSKSSVALALKEKQVFASVGIHPHHADEVRDTDFDEIEALAKNKKVVAIGEVGLDYFKNFSSQKNQKIVFIRFLELAGKLNLPVVIHDRDAHTDVAAILKEVCAGPISGVMHCFSGDKKVMKEMLDLGLHISFTCNLTFKNAKVLRDAAKYVPKDKLLLETDAPFLAPQKYRGKRNEPAYIIELRDILSQLLEISKKDIEEITTQNAKKLFRIM